MQQLFEYLMNDICDQKILKEESLLVAEDMINESFKCELLTNLANQIAQAEKKNNARKAQRNKEKEEHGYYGREELTSFASIFGPLTVNGRYDSKKGIQGLKWSEITDDDFVYVPAGNEKQLKKALKPIYAKNGKGNVIVCLPDTKTPVMYIKGYGKDNDKRLFYFNMNTTYGSGIQQKTAKKYSYQERPLKLEEAMEYIVDLDVYILNVTDELIQQYTSLQKSREEAQKGVINYDKESLAALLKKQKARYKALADEMRAKKLQKDPNALFDEIKEVNDDIVNLYKEVTSNPEYLDKNFGIAELMDYVARSYETLYKSLSYSRSADRSVARAKERGNEDAEKWGEWDRSYAKEYINDAKEYLEKAKKYVAEIRAEMKK